MLLYRLKALAVGSLHKANHYKTLFAKLEITFKLTLIGLLQNDQEMFQIMCLICICFSTYLSSARRDVVRLS